MDNLNGCIPILFTRVPVPGLVKTRLQQRLTPVECAVLQEALTIDLATRISETFGHFVLCYSDEWRYVLGGCDLRDMFVARVIQACNPSCQVHARCQRGDGLGERMTQAIQEAFELGASSCMLLGSDLPDVESSDLLAAQSELARCDVVLGPGMDGGYWVVGLNAPFPELFAQRRFSTGRVLQDALDTCRLHGKEARLVRTAIDIDEPADLSLVESGLVKAGPHVQRVMGRTPESLLSGCEVWPREICGRSVVRMPSNFGQRVGRVEK